MYDQGQTVSQDCVATEKDTYMTTLQFRLEVLAKTLEEVGQLSTRMSGLTYPAGDECEKAPSPSNRMEEVIEYVNRMILVANETCENMNRTL